MRSGDAGDGCACAALAAGSPERRTRRATARPASWPCRLSQPQWTPRYRRLAPHSSCAWLNDDTTRVVALPVPLLVPASQGSDVSVTAPPSGRMASPNSARRISKPAAALVLWPEVLDGCAGVDPSGCQPVKPLLTAPSASALSAVIGRQNFCSYFEANPTTRASASAFASSANA